MSPWATSTRLTEDQRAGGGMSVSRETFDFESGEAEGAAGWGYRDVLPYFKRAERRAGGGDEYRGAEGPLATRRGTLENPLSAAWLEAGRQAGYALTAEMNGFRQEGLGEM